MKEAPEKIYLQWVGTEFDDESTWCTDQINDEDIEYVKAVLADRRLELLRRTKRYLYHRDECAVNYSDPVCDCRLSKLLLELVEELGDD